MQASSVCAVSPGECRDSSMGGHEVVFEVEVGEVVAVEQLGGELLQTAAGQIDGADPLRGDLTQEDKTH